MSSFGLVAQQLALAAWSSLQGRADYDLRPHAGKPGHQRVDPAEMQHRSPLVHGEAGKALARLREELASTPHDERRTREAAAYLTFLRARPASELPFGERPRAVEAFVQSGRTIEAAAFVLRAGWESRRFWSEVFVDARRAPPSDDLNRLLGRGLAFLASSGADPEELTEALDTLADYPPSPHIDALLARAMDASGTSPRARASFWRARARRATREHREAELETAVTASGTTEAWLVFAELLHESGHSLEIVRRALRKAPHPSQERLQFLDALHDEREAAEESERLAREPKARPADMQDALRRWTKLASPSRAQALWDHIANHANRDREALLWLIQAAVELHDGARVDRAAKALLRLNPRDDAARESVGEAWDGLEQRQKALSMWRAMDEGAAGAPSRSPRTTAQNVAEVLLRHGHPAAALEAIRPLLDAHPQDVRLRRTEALALEQERRRDEAFVTWWAVFEAPALAPDARQEARQHLLELTSAARNPDLENVAAALANRRAALEPLDDSVLLAQILRRLGRSDEARTMLIATGREWLTSHPTAEEREHARSSLAALGGALHDLRAFAEERELWRRATESEGPPCAFCLWQRAAASVEQGRLKEAEETLERSKDLVEAASEILLRSRDLAERLGRPDLAETLASRAACIDPSSPTTVLALTRARLRAGDLAGAVRISAMPAVTRSLTGDGGDLATDEVSRAARDLATWTKGVEETSMSAPSTADLLKRVRPLLRDEPRERREDDVTWNERMEALRELGGRAANGPLPFRATESLVRGEAGSVRQRERLEALIWFVGANHEDEATTSLRRLARNDTPGTAALAILAAARTGALDGAELGSVIEQDTLAPEVRAAAALALGWSAVARQEPATAERLFRASATATSLVANAAARALAALAPRSLADEVARRAQLDPSSPFAIAASAWGHPLPPYLPWNRGERLETRSAILQMAAANTASASPPLLPRDQRRSAIPRTSEDEEGASP